MDNYGQVFGISFEQMQFYDRPIDGEHRHCILLPPPTLALPQKKMYWWEI